MTLWQELWQYLSENYFNATLQNNYLHFDLSGIHTSLLAIVGGLCIALVAASLISFFSGRGEAYMVKKMQEKQAFSKEEAKTLEELGISFYPLLKFSLSRPSLLRKWVSICQKDEVLTYQKELEEAFPEFAEKAKKEALQPHDGEEAYLSAEEANEPSSHENTPSDDKNKAKGQKSFRLKKLDFANDRFFLEGENKDHAITYFEKRGGNLIFLLLSVILAIALFFLSLYFIPVLVSLLDVSVDKWISH